MFVMFVWSLTLPLKEKIVSPKFPAFTAGDEELQYVSSFKYLGSNSLMIYGMMTILSLKSNVCLLGVVFYYLALNFDHFLVCSLLWT